VIEDGAVSGAGSTIGAFALIGADVTLAANVEVRNHGVVTGWTEVDEGTVVHPFAVVGGPPQDLKYRGAKTKLVVGKNNRIREGATLNTGTEDGGGITRVGDNCLFMTGAHVGHDVQVGDNVVMANQAALAGHCQIADDVIIGGLSGIHQWVRIGRGAIIGAVTMVTADVLPHALIQGPRGELAGLNLVGLKRRGVSRDDINALRVALQSMKDGEGSFQDRVRRIAEESPDSPYVRELTDFVLGATDRGYLTP
jgi:UDP-N-acetylglucosamine acyltransferase